MGVAEAAGTEIIHYGPTEILPGVVINMQTMYMSWLTMLIVAAIVFAATRHVERIPHGIQNLVEMFIEWLDKLMDANLGIEGRRMATPFVITLFLFIFVANEIGLMPSIAFHFRHLRMISTWRWVYPSCCGGNLYLWLHQAGTEILQTSHFSFCPHAAAQSFGRARKATDHGPASFWQHPCR